LEILGVLWQALADGAPALRLSEVRELLQGRYGRQSEPSTVSTQLRSLLAKGWLELTEASVGAPALVRTRGAAPVRGVVRTRGTARATGNAVRPRSPFTAYRPKHSIAETMGPLLGELAAAYPEAERHRFLLDAARALKLPAQTVAEIEKLVAPKPGK
jgi:hypothetical protein